MNSTYHEDIVKEIKKQMAVTVVYGKMNSSKIDKDYLRDVYKLFKDILEEYENISSKLPIDK